MNRRFLCLLLLASAAACGRETMVRPTPHAVVTPQPSPKAGSSSLWIAPGVPDSLRLAAQGSGLPIAAHAADATIVLGHDAAQETASITWIYALVAPFPTVLDDVSANGLRSAWAGTPGQPYASWPLFLTSPTASALEPLWGEPGAAVEIVDSERILDMAWAERPSWAILPLEMLEPRWKVLSIDGQSPIRKDFDAAADAERSNIFSEYRSRVLSMTPPISSLRSNILI